MPRTVPTVIPPKERGLRKLAAALSLAAALVVMTVGLSVWPRHPMATEPVFGGIVDAASRPIDSNPVRDAHATPPTNALGPTGKGEDRRHERHRH
jgi:hypothetical protein